MDIKEIRQKYPQYSDVSDGDLVQALHKKYYSDIPYQQFEQKVFGTKPIKVGVEGLPDAIKQVSQEFGPLSKVAIGGAGAINKMAMRFKQLLGRELTPQDIQGLKEYEALNQASGAAVGGDIGMNLLATAIPGAGLQAGLTNVASKVLPAVVAPTVGAAATGGAIAGATTPVLEGDSTLKNVALGAAGGAAGDAAGRVLSRVVQPLGQSRDVQKLVSEGVVPTPGQAAGGIVNKVEQKLMSVPILGDVIRSSRERATQELDLAAINRALPKTAKGQITAVGRQAIEKADEILGQGYDDVYKQITVKPDQTFLREAVRVKNDPDLALPKELQGRLGEIVRTQVLDRVKKGDIPGPLAQRIDSNLGSLSRRYLSSADADQRVLGIAIREIQKSFKGLVERNAGPEAAATIKDLNASYAQFLRVERAASMQGAKDGVFTAEQLSSAVRALDKSSNKGNFAKGSALMQDLSDSAKNVLGGSVPNSGTTDRALLAYLLANPLQGTLAAGTGLAVSPLYSRAGSRYFLGDLPGQGTIASTLRELSPYFSQVGRAATQ